MPPLDRRRRRLLTPGLGIAAAGGVLLLVVVGGAYKVGPASGPYHRDVNRSYVAAGSVQVESSNQEGAELAGLLRDMPGLQRDNLVNRLASLASGSSRLAHSAAQLAPPEPTVAGLPEALAERARALGGLRGAVDGLLAVAGSAQVGAATAADRIEAAGELLSRADRDYARVRRAFRSAPGSASLPRSAWVDDASAWAPGPVATLVADLGSSPTLAPRVRLVLLPSTVAFQPAAVPRVKPGGASVVPPTNRLAVAFDVANRGNVPLHSMLVSARATPQGPGAPATASTRVTLAPYSMVAVSLPGFAVTPRDTYTVTVAVVPPAGQTSLATTSLTYDIKVAPPTPPPTTTTTTTRPTTTTTTRPATTTTTPTTTTAGSTPATRPGA